MVTAQRATRAGYANSEIMSGLERLVIGALGGLAAVMVKYLSQDHSAVVNWFQSHLTYSDLNAIVGGYYFLAPILMVLGAIIGWCSNESNRLKLLALGISAPALITTFGGTGSAPVSTVRKAVGFLQPSSALAQAATPGNPLAEGLSSFFGGADRSYTIDVGSFKEKSEADRVVERINHSTKSLRAFADELKTEPTNPSYHVYLTQMFSLKEALALRDAVLKSRIAEEALITQLPGILPPGTEGWVAIGYLNSSSNDDVNFSLSNNEAIKSRLEQNTIVKAKTEVNLRPGPATWGRVVGVLDAGQCFQVQESRSIDVKGRPQTWARGNVKECS